MVEYQRWRRYIEDVGYIVDRQSEALVDAEGGYPRCASMRRVKWTISTASVST
jgi:hypothetical protein